MGLDGGDGPLLSRHRKTEREKRQHDGCGNPSRKHYWFDRGQCHYHGEPGCHHHRLGYYRLEGY
ncbi:MAG: hypothetical protein H6Q67_2077 [Firmicutes bacterium]|nr:hypothetical protein [Bacillota bacterium]